MQDFLNLIFQNVTRVTGKTATAIDHILENSFIDRTKQVSLSLMFLISLQFAFLYPHICRNEIVNIHKRIINKETVKVFSQHLYKNNLNDIECIRNPNDTYSIFLEHFVSCMTNIFL